VASNAAIKVLKAQDATSAAAVAERFHLTPSEQQRLITFGRQEALVLAGGKRVTITIQASQREHALITTNPVERAADYLRLAPVREDSRPIDAHVQTAAESLTVDITQQKTVPLHLLMGQEEATQTMNTRTNSHRQSGHKQKIKGERQE
jgi:hypothetical protein